MVNLTTFYNRNIYNTEGKFIGQVNEIVLNIKKGRISFFKTKAITEENRSAGLRDVIRNSMRIVPEEETMNQVTTEGIIDIPYELVSAVGDIILVDQNKLTQYQNAMKQKQMKRQPQSIPQPKINSQKQ
ncbi:MAG: photosystem reaction center subunit H [Methanosphaera stadtmanae]|jgi:sporulation protein YlmC with PRC-barrel domain|nr:photosystem reaction center subunit H [Methanosphaera stadtmanae]